MADQYGLFWNSINSDRTYDADSFAEWLRKFFTTGIFNGEMQVTPSTGMTVSVAPGYANLNGKVRFFDAIQTFTLDPASGSYPRIDTIVVRSDSTNRTITTEYVKGAYSGNNPVPTAPVRSAGIYEIVLAQILVGAGITAIMTQDITDTRPDDDLCGWVTSTVEGVPMGQIVAQMQADFLAWYDRMKGQLSEDAAGHLQSQIDSTNQTVASLQDQVDTNVEYFDGRIDNVNDTVGENTDAIIGLRAKSESALYAISRYFEPSSTAITSHVEGEYFLWQYSDDPNQVILVRTINYIGTGNRIAEGINVAHTSVGEALDALNNGLTSVRNELSLKSLTLQSANSAVTVTVQSARLFGNVLEISASFTLSSQVNAYGNLITLGGKSALIGWVLPVYTASLVPVTDQSVYGDTGNANIRASRNLPAGTYRIGGIILVN